MDICPRLNGLTIEPHPPERFDQLTMTRAFRSVTYHIAMKHAGKRTVNIDSKPLDSNIAPIPSDSTKSVEVAVHVLTLAITSIRPAQIGRMAIFCVPFAVLPRHIITGNRTASLTKYSYNSRTSALIT